jgi:hypothetical protein
MQPYQSSKAAIAVCIKKNMNIPIYFSVSVLLFSGCLAADNEGAISNFKFPYDLSRPDTVLVLPPILEEVSGLEFDETGQLACVQDEDGVIFFYDIARQEIVKEAVFAGAGDYEGIAFAKGQAFVLKTDGTLYEITDLAAPSQSVIIHTTPLSEKNDPEGLTYDPEQNALLIACKARAGLNKGTFPNERAVYRFDLSSKVLVETPFLRFTAKALENYLQRHPNEDVDINLPLDKDEDLPFKPSGIAVHDGLYYTLASSGKLLLVTDNDGTLLHVAALDANLMPKPEGIAFDAKGNLYIATEADGDTPKLLIFNNHSD